MHSCRQKRHAESGEKPGESVTVIPCAPAYGCSSTVLRRSASADRERILFGKRRVFAGILCGFQENATHLRAKSAARWRSCIGKKSCQKDQKTRSIWQDKIFIKKSKFTIDKMKTFCYNSMAIKNILHF